jgi:hypothetical protein
MEKARPSLLTAKSKTLNGERGLKKVVWEGKQNEGKQKTTEPNSIAITFNCKFNY